MTIRRKGPSCNGTAYATTDPPRRRKQTREKTLKRRKTAPHHHSSSPSHLINHPTSSSSLSSLSGRRHAQTKEKPRRGKKIETRTQIESKVPIIIHSHNPISHQPFHSPPSLQPPQPRQERSLRGRSGKGDKPKVRLPQIGCSFSPSHPRSRHGLHFAAQQLELPPGGACCCSGPVQGSKLTLFLNGCLFLWFVRSMHI
jgi:hypothetical protein